MGWLEKIVEASSVNDLAAVRELWKEYWKSLGLPPDFQNFTEELATLPGKYAPPAGRLFLARLDGPPAGTAALRPLSNGACEAKRLYVRPAYRRRGLAASLLTKVRIP
jgi:putative acetyltransferase